MGRISGKSSLAWLLCFASLSCTTSSPGSTSTSSSSSSSSSTSTSSSSSARSSAPPTATESESATDPGPPFFSPEVFTLWIRGGTVLDGSGSPPRLADVLIRKDRIAFVGRVDLRVRAIRTIDATGLTVTPGFIDMHSHLPPTGDVESALAQGVTTIVVGQDGASAESIAQFLDQVDAASPRVDVATMVGHGTAHTLAGIGARSASGKKERDAIAVVVARGMQEGAFGLSTGLEYEPGRFADEDELAAAVEPVGRAGGMVMSHLRSEDDASIEAALDELISQCRRGKARAHIAHLKSVLGHGAERAQVLLDKLESARQSGLEITSDAYPYTASFTTIGILFPAFAKPPSDYPTALRKQRQELLRSLRETVERRNGPTATLFGTGRYSGSTLAEVADREKIPFEEVLAKLGPDGASAAYFVIDEALQEKLIEDRWVMIGTDGGGGSRHPRGHGSFPRFLHDYAVKNRRLTLAESVRKITGLPAHTLRLDHQEGCLSEGCLANVDVFDPGALEDRASFTDPHHLAGGMSWVIVRGVVEREKEKALPARAGRALHYRNLGTRN